MEDQYDLLFKILLVGDSSVGKTSVLLRYTDRTFSPMYQTTIGVDFRIATLNINNKIIKLQLWDTAGQDRYRRIVSSYYRGAHGLILVYDITNRTSFENVRNWLEECDSRVGNTVKLLIGNKKDKENERKVATEEGRVLAEQLGMEFMETSAKCDVNIDDAFQRLSNSIAERKFSGVAQTGQVLAGKHVDGNKPRTWCCYL
jgi:Ras-related protein Rab-1A